MKICMQDITNMNDNLAFLLCTTIHIEMDITIVVRRITTADTVTAAPMVIPKLLCESTKCFKIMHLAIKIIKCQY